MAGYLLTVVAAGALALSWASDRDERREVSLTLTEERQGAYRLEGGFYVEVSCQTVWEVLTDYDRIDEFVSSMKASAVKEVKEGRILLEQVAFGRVLIFSKEIHVLLEVHEEPMSRIAFEDVLHKDFKFYAGSWALEEISDGCRVRYQLQATPDFSAPNFIVKEIFMETAKNLLEEVRLEIGKRARGQAIK
jgi:ribosome-associated toxin RatA of RatAB toxin-antitoxin module